MVHTAEKYLTKELTESLFKIIYSTYKRNHTKQVVSITIALNTGEMAN